LAKNQEQETRRKKRNHDLFKDFKAKNTSILFFVDGKKGTSVPVLTV
jgi:hypothetical protein